MGVWDWDVGVIWGASSTQWGSSWGQGQTDLVEPAEFAREISSLDCSRK